MQEKSENSKTKIKIVDWLVTDECMLHCPFCFRPSYIKTEVDGDQTIMQQIKESNVEGVNLTGGEPLIREDIGDITKKLYEYGKTLVLFTNTMLWKERMQDVQSYLSYVRIPLDGSTPEMTEKHRTSREQFNKVIEFLEYSSNGFKPTVYVGTVVTTLNKDDITDIAHVIERYSQVQKWSISQLTPRGIGIEYSSKLTISDSEFEDITSEVIENFPHLQVVPVNARKRNRAYALILPSLEVVVPCGDKYEIIGNLRKDRLANILSSPALDLQKTHQRGSCYKT